MRLDGIRKTGFSLAGGVPGRRFDLSVEATMKLRREGVGGSVIQAMTDRGCH
jgi:hypothetical protein